MCLIIVSTQHYLHFNFMDKPRCIYNSAGWICGFAFHFWRQLVVVGSSECCPLEAAATLKRQQHPCIKALETMFRCISHVFKLCHANFSREFIPDIPWRNCHFGLSFSWLQFGRYFYQGYCCSPLLFHTAFRTFFCAGPCLLAGDLRRFVTWTGGAVRCGCSRNAPGNCLRSHSQLHTVDRSNNSAFSAGPAALARFSFETTPGNMIQLNLFPQNKSTAFKCKLFSLSGVAKGFFGWKSTNLDAWDGEFQQPCYLCYFRRLWIQSENLFQEFRLFENRAHLSRTTDLSGFFLARPTFCVSRHTFSPPTGSFIQTRIPSKIVKHKFARFVPEKLSCSPNARAALGQVA